MRSAGIMLSGLYKGNLILGWIIAALINLA